MPQLVWVRAAIPHEALSSHEALEEGDGVVAGQGEGGGLDGLARPAAYQKTPQGEAQHPCGDAGQVEDGVGNDREDKNSCGAVAPHPPL